MRSRLPLSGSVRAWIDEGRRPWRRSRPSRGGKITTHGDALGVGLLDPTPIGLRRRLLGICPSPRRSAGGSTCRRCRRSPCASSRRRCRSPGVLVGPDRGRAGRCPGGPGRSPDALGNRMKTLLEACPPAHAWDPWKVELFVVGVARMAVGAGRRCPSCSGFDADSFAATIRPVRQRPGRM